MFGAPFPVGLSARFSFIMDGLRGVLADHMSREQATIPLLHVIWTMLRRRADRFARLVARFEAGVLAVRRPRQAGSSPSDAPSGDAPASNRRRVRAPSREAWRLVRMIHGTAVYDALLRRLVEEPEMARLLAAAPQAGRLLRPVLQMLSPHPLPATLQGARGSRSAASPALDGAPARDFQGSARLEPLCPARTCSRVPRARFGPQIWA